MGGAFGSTATIGSTVKPIARRSGATTSSAVADRGRVPLRQDFEIGQRERPLGHGSLSVEDAVEQSRPTAWTTQCTREGRQE